eukprot:4205-Heterococcus_DN1.PRE.1
MALAYCCYSRPVRLIRRIFARDDAHVTVEIVPGGSAEAPANLHAYANSLRLQQSALQGDGIVRLVALTLRRVTLLMNSTLYSCTLANSVMINLLSNAIKYTATNSKVTVSYR